MNSKLTLTIDRNIIFRANNFAQQKGRSLSDLIESLLKLVATESKEEIEITSKVKNLMGSFSAPKNIDYKKELSKSISKKHLK